MSVSSTDSKNEAVTVESTSFMLPPDSLETIVLLLSISAALTTSLHSISITHLIGISFFVFVAQAISIVFSPRSISLLPWLHKSSRKAAEEKLEEVGKILLAGISGVAPEDKVQYPETGQYTEAGKHFQYRAGIIGALTIFVLVYIVVSVIYSKAYSAAEASALIAELDCKPAKRLSRPQKRSAPDTVHESKNSANCNPLFSPEFNIITKNSITARVHENPLKLPEAEKQLHKTCCTGCEALEKAQADWIEAVEQYDEANDTVLEENSRLKDCVTKLQIEVIRLRQEIKILDDRNQYLDVLLEEAGKQLDREADVKDVLWDAYCKRRKSTGADDSSEEIEITASSPPYLENGA